MSRYALPLSLVLLAGAGVATAGPAPAPAVKVGDAALLFSLPAVNEDAALRAVSKPHVGISDFTGVLPAFPARVVVVHFVRRAGSDAQLQALNRLQKKYGNRGARVVAIVEDDGELASLSGWVESLKLEYPVLRDAYKVVTGRYGVQRFPMTMVVEASGDIVALGTPGDDLEAGLESIVSPFVQ